MAVGERSLGGASVREPGTIGSVVSRGNTDSGVGKTYISRASPNDALFHMDIDAPLAVYNAESRDGSAAD
jgi:hypothetical protein